MMNGQKNKNPDERNDINLYEYWLVAVRYRKFIITVTAAAFALSIAVGLLLPKRYTATVSVMPPQHEAGMPGAGVLAGLPGGIGGMAGSFLGTKSPADLWVGILKSGNVIEGIIKRFNLKERYHVSLEEDAEKVLRKSISVAKSREDIISVSVEDKDPKAAAEMANAFVEELDRINRSTTMTSGARMRAFVEKRLSEAKQELSRTEEALKKFQEKNRAIKLDEQSKVMIEAMGEVNGKLMAKEVQLETLMSYAAPTNPNVEILKSEISSLKQKLSELEKGAGPLSADDSKSIFIPAKKYPDLALQYVRLKRDAKIQETLFDLLTQQYEVARIQEAKDSPTVQVLDMAKVPEKKSKPKIFMIVFVATISGFSGSVISVLLKEHLDSLKSHVA